MKRRIHELLADWLRNTPPPQPLPSDDSIGFQGRVAVGLFLFAGIMDMTYPLGSRKERSPQVDIPVHVTGIPARNFDFDAMPNDKRRAWLQGARIINAPLLKDGGAACLFMDNEGNALVYRKTEFLREDSCRVIRADIEKHFVENGTRGMPRIAAR
jgi:hypothetical protein